MWKEYESNASALEALRRRMDYVFSEWQNDAAPRGWQPRTVLTETEGAWLLTVDVPGFTEKDIQLSLHGEQLTLRGERKQDETEGWSVHRVERGAMQFERVLTLPTMVAPDGVSASVQDGVLLVTLPKAEAAKPRTIPVMTH